MNKYNWDLSKLIRDHDHFLEQIDEIKELLDKYKSYENNYRNSFGPYLETYEELSRRMSNLLAYAKMKHDEDTKEDYGQKINLQAQDLYNDFATITSSFRPNILKLSQEELDRLIDQEGLEKYRLFLQRIYRYKDHILDPDQERILSAMGFLQTGPSKAYGLLTNADMEFKDMESTDKELSHASFVSLLKDSDVMVRKEAFDKYYEAYRSIDNGISSLYLDNVRALTTEAQLRNFDSARQMELYKDRVSLEVYDNMIQAVRENLPSLHKYYKIKKKALGLEEQHMYDIYLPLYSDLDTDIDYDQAKDIILEAFRPLGEEYVSVINEAFESNWIDVYPRKGKTSGAYSYGTYDSDPYIMMNYNDDFNSLFTLAHELGHSMHSYYSNKNNEYLYANYTIFVAEVASTTNELLLLNYLMDRADNDQEKIFLIDHYIDSFKSTVFRQTMFAEFEKISHQSVEEGSLLSLRDFNEIYYKLNQDYYGPHVISDKDIELEWARIPHFYRNFYVYKYATGFSTAVILSENILSGDKGKVATYLDFLKDGGKNFPLDQLKKAGADIESKETMDQAMEVFRSLVDQLENLLD